MRELYLKKQILKIKKRILILFLIFFYLINTQAFAIDYKQQRIPFVVEKFASKHQCTNLTKHPSFNRPFYGYKGYDVYIGNTLFEEKEEDCIILYKYGIVRFAEPKEYFQIYFIEPPPLPIGLWGQYWHEYRKYMYHIPLRKLLFG